ncbi:MAG: beta-lactamase [Elusimicrobia bacterium]|nr:MAG: beta-lactamase [Elusimicrobiota bacterium]KAF0158001.1 MAG: beta-lactamase [Elusimicrobiota bacterium]
MNLLKFILTLALVLPLAAADKRPPRAAKKAPAAAADAVPPEVRKQLVKAAWSVASKISPDPRKVESSFSPAFFKLVEKEKVTDMLKSLREKHGAVKRVSLSSTEGTNTAHFIFHTDQDYMLPTSVTVDPASGLITGLFFRPAYQHVAGMADIKEKLAALPGRKSLLLTRLEGRDGPVESLEPDEPLNIGSTFKLYVLAQLQESKAQWKKTVEIPAAARSLPSGRLHAWPEGAPFTVYTLTAQMISESDNTAADALIDLAGRRSIERNLAKFGHYSPDRMKPFLKTSEYFRIKGSTAAAAGWTAARQDDRYDLLDKKIPSLPLSAPALPAAPFEVSRIGWFASASDLCRVMDRFRKSGDAAVLDILAINHGLPVDRKAVPYAGYKGGSDIGAINMTWLFRTRASAWYCLSATWNDEKAPLDEKEFFGIMQGALKLVEADNF